MFTMNHKNYMNNDMNNPTKLAEWQKLVQHQEAMSQQRMRDWFATDADRFTRFSLQVGEIFLDYSRHLINQETLKLLINLAQARHLPQKIHALFSGSPINSTEKRPALHTALRDKKRTAILVNRENIATQIEQTQAKIAAFVDQIHSHAWKGVTGKPIAHIVNIGIGGSHLGPMMCAHALKDFAISQLQFHFISTIDNAALDEVLQQIDPETTLFLISSKSFTTIETMTNVKTVCSWMKNKLGDTVMQHHFIAMTANVEKALAFGISADNIFPLWEWIGGRYSIWSAVGLPLLLMIGNKQFHAFLEGAYEMDQHFCHAEFSQNMPVLLALLSIWYVNFFHASIQAIVPYSHRLRYLIPYLQQATMESNGKSTSMSGHGIDYATSPVIFGEEGISGQHAYHQLLHQGQHLIPVDFILLGKDKTHEHQDILLASALSQAEALMRGKTFSEAFNDLIARNMPETEATQLAKHQVTQGNKPSNILLLERLTPKNLGALLALYEHKIFVQAAIWDINSFDQWGVELGKELLPSILQRIKTYAQTSSGSINHFKKIQEKL